MRDQGVVELFLKFQTSQGHAHAEDEKQVGENTTDQRGLDNADLFLNQGDDEDDKLDGIAKTNIEQGGDGGTGSVRQTFCREGQKTSKRDDGDSIQGEVDVLIDTGAMNGDTSRNKDQEQIEP